MLPSLLVNTVLVLASWPFTPYEVIDALAHHGYNASAAAGNPLKGFLTSPEWSAWPYSQSVPSSMEYYYVPLSSIINLSPNASEGFDSYLEPRLAASASRGMHAVLRFYLDYPGREDPYETIPQFLIDGGLSFNSYSDHGGGESPDYTDESLLSALESFVAQLGERYDGDARIGFIQIGLLGFWGEWHTWPYDWIPSTTKDRLVAAFDGAFEATQLQLRVPWGAADAAADGDGESIGLHDDSFAYSTLDGAYNGGVDTEWFFWPSVESAGWSQVWRGAAMGGELRPELQAEVFDDDYAAGTEYKQEVLACVEVTHATYMLNYYAFAAGSGYHGSALQRAQTAALRMGYEYVVSGIAAAAVGDEVTLAVNVSNLGVAPFYYPLRLRLECGDEAREAADAQPRG